MYLSKSISETRYYKAASKLPSNIGATSANIRKLLHSLDFVGWSSHEESGRLDRRALTRFGTGSANIFSRREYTPAETSAVSVLIDLSASMRGDRIDVAQTVTIHLSKVLQQSRVPFRVTGFYSDSMTVSSINRSDNQSHSPVFIDFKPWRKSMQSCIHALGAIDQCVTGGTPDYSSIYNAIDDLSKRNEHRRILFIITDANGYNHQHMEHLQKLADKLGVVLIVIGINSRDVSCFVNSVNVQDLDDLGSVAFNQLLKTVKRKIK